MNILSYFSKSYEASNENVYFPDINLYHLEHSIQRTYGREMPREKMLQVIMGSNNEYKYKLYKAHVSGKFQW